MSEHSKHSRLSQELHAGLTTAPCPVDGGCGGNCKTVHPRGIAIRGDGSWYAVPPVPETVHPMKMGTDL